jgi:hypothetical protein
MDSNEGETQLKKLSANTIIYTLLLSTNIALVWLLPYFPTQDGPSHMYNLVILHDLLNGGKVWGSTYTYKLQATPNLGFHLLAYPLLCLFKPLAVEKIFISLYILLMGVSVPVFLRTFSGRVFPFAYFVYPILFNFCLMMGFYSYVITVPCFLLAVSASWKMRYSPVLYRMIWFNVLGIFLFYFHLIPSVLYIIALSIMTFTEPASLKSKIRKTAGLIIIMAPWFLSFSFYMWRSSSIETPPLAISHMSGVDLLRDFFSFSTVTLDPLQETVATILLVLYLFFFSVYLYGFAKGLLQRRTSLRELPWQDKFLLIFFIILVSIYFLAPFSIGEGSFFNQRFPWVIFLITLPLLRSPEQILTKRTCLFASIGIALFSLGVNAKILRIKSAVVKNFLSGLQVSIPSGAFIMLYKGEDSDGSRVDVLMHASSYYAISKNCVDIGNYEAGTNFFPVHFRSDIPAIPMQDEIIYNPQTIKWELYPSIQYLLCWNVDYETRSKLRMFFKIKWEKGFLSIWQRLPPDL